MKKCPIRLDKPEQIVYICVDGSGTAFGPYSSMASAKKAAGRANVDCEIARVSVKTDVLTKTTYRGNK